MKTVIVGAGRRGFALARYLAEGGNDVVIIDVDADRIRNANDKLDCMAISGSALDLEVLRSAGIASADSFVAISDNDEVNLISCGIVSSEFGIRKTIASVRNLEYTNRGGLSQSIFGINYIVNPEEEAARSIVNAIERGMYSGIITFSDSPLMIYNIRVLAGGMLDGSNLIEIKTNLKADFVIAAVYRDGDAFVPSGKTVINAGDIISIVMEKSMAGPVLKKMGQEKPKPRRVVVVGGTQISDFLFSNLDISKLSSLVLIEKRQDVCQKFAEKYPSVLVLNGDLASEDIIGDENLDGYDLLIALEDSDELNTILACYAKKRGMRHTIALVKHKNNYATIAPDLGIDMIISTTEATVMTLLGFVNDDSVSSVHSIFGGQIEIYEFIVSDKSACRGKCLMEIDMKGKAIIAGITRSDGRSLIPNGKTVLSVGDTLLVLVDKGKMAAVKGLLA